MISEDKTIRHYNKKARGLAERYESADVGKLQNELLNALKKCRNILELGCGSGRDAAFLLSSSTGRKLTITDGSNEMLRRAAEVHPELSPYLRKLELPEDLARETGKYDGIYSIAALMHLPEPDIVETINRIAGLLMPGGIMFISVCTEREENSPGESRTFTLKNRDWWTRQIETSGLVVMEVTESTDGLKRENTVWLNVTAQSP
ncbi:MAG: class I SAM-dependent methyltransferase [Candidatus Sabulitectum sp.]|nr:class I SAM-dependent methyltransferase [Candidatus Sabulitectum sp.]